MDVKMDSIYTIDIESNNLLEGMLDFSSFPYKLNKDAKLWCVVIYNVKTGETKEAVKDEITYEWMKESLKDCKYLIAHNGVKFDWIALKLFGVMDYRIGYLSEDDTLFGKPVTFLDSLIISRLFNPDRFGGHSLKAWGKKLSNHKDDFRQQCIDDGIIEKGAPKGAEFKQWSPRMLEYCRQDTIVNADVYKALLKEGSGYNWKDSIKLEHKLADLAIRRESLGFWFDKDLAIELVEDLTNKMQELTDKVNPILPPKPMNIGELNEYTPPKIQVKKDGDLSSHMKKFIERTNGEASQLGEDWYVSYDDGRSYKVPFEEPVKTTVQGTIDDLNHVKQTLIDDYGWVPSEWRERDLTKDSKKQSLPYHKRIAALERWYKETMNGKFKKLRLKELGIKPENILEELSQKLEQDFPVRVPTSPPIRVGVEKDLCPNLLKLGEKVEFAKDFALYLTYKHRKTSIAGGDIEDLDLEEDVPNTGYLANYREVDGRIATPAFEIGTSTSRYQHQKVVNIPRPSSIYGKEMRSLFGAGKGFVQLGYDFSSLENRIQGSYIYKYKGGPEMAESLVAEKPNDAHTKNAQILGIDRSEAKSFTYAVLYGAAPKKISKMLGCSLKKAKEYIDSFWKGNPALNSLKTNLEAHWEKNDKKYIYGIDGRKVPTRSKHSLLNALFQSGGVLVTKYSLVYAFEEFEKLGYCIDPFINKPDIGEMISYHDEAQLVTDKKNLKFKVFNNEDEAKKFVESYNDGQLSDISKGKGDKYFVCLPNVISETLIKSINKTRVKFDIPVELGIEWVVGKNWKDCH